MRAFQNDTYRLHWPRRRQDIGHCQFLICNVCCALIRLRRWYRFKNQDGRLKLHTAINRASNAMIKLLCYCAMPSPSSSSTYSLLLYYCSTMEDHQTSSSCDVNLLILDRTIMRPLHYTSTSNRHFVHRRGLTRRMKLLQR